MNEQQFNQMLKRQNLTCRRQRQRQLLVGVADATGHWTHRRQQRSDPLRRRGMPGHRTDSPGIYNNE